MKVDFNCLEPGNVHLNNLNDPVLSVLISVDMYHRLKTIIINFIATYLEVQQYWLLMLILNIINLAVRYLIVCVNSYSS